MPAATVVKGENLPRKRKPRSCSVSCRKRRRRRFPHVMSCLTRGFALLHHFCPSTNSVTKLLRWQRKRKRFTTSTGGVMQDVKAIYRKHQKRRGRSKYLLSVEAAVRKGAESLPVRLVFIRNCNTRKDWLVLVTTNMSLTEEEVIRIYGKLWGIEVFFKVCKSYLRLEKDCRTFSYDAMTAHVSIVFTW